MFGLSALELARIQFAFTVSFHIIFLQSPSAWRHSWRCLRDVAENPQ